ncbi:MAG: hypothetical protein IJY37_06780 [Clostridia bacterium]|nr:hypothetical protein [Clostridia bacterium]
MIKINCDFELIYCESECVGMVFDLSDVVQKCICSLDAILENKTKQILLEDNKQKKYVLLDIGEKNFRHEQEAKLSLPRAEWEIIRNLLLDVFIGAGFSGYHYDLAVSNDMELTFLMQK